MATFRSIKELTRALQQGSKLLSNMFLQRKTTYSGAYPFSIPGLQSAVRSAKIGSF